MTAQPALRRFAGAYLNEDWNIEYASDAAALRDFVKDAPELAGRLPSEIEHLLESVPDDELLAGVLDEELAIGYSPAAEGLTDRQWLRRVAEQVQALLRDQ